MNYDLVITAVSSFAFGCVVWGAWKNYSAPAATAARNAAKALALLKSLETVKPDASIAAGQEAALKVKLADIKAEAEKL